MNEEWYNAIVEDCKAIITEKFYAYNMELIELKHLIGERICTDKNFKKLAGSRNATLKKIFEDIGIGKSDGYACVAFYEKYPKLSTIVESSKEQKRLSWNLIKTNYLPVKKESKKECLHEDTYSIELCRDCGNRIVK